jgi:hypothetical protein
MPSEEEIKKLIPAEFFMISGSHDSQTSADVYNVNKFELPNPAGKAGGACTSALLQVLYKEGQASDAMSWVDLLRKMRSALGYVVFLFCAVLYRKQFGDYAHPFMSCYLTIISGAWDTIRFPS